MAGARRAAEDAPDTRGKILDAAEALFARRGYPGVGLREVADAVGIGKSSLFHHFSAKAQLYFEVLERVLERIDAHVTPALATGGDTLAQIDACLDALIDALTEHPTTARLLLRALFEEDDVTEQPPEAKQCEQTLARILGGVQDLLRRGVEQGALRPMSVPDTMQTLIGATVYHFASGSFGEDLMGGPLLSKQAVARRKRELRDLMHRGLAAASPATEDLS